MLLLREIDKKLKLTEQLAKLVPDDRDQDRIQHSMQSMLQQRIYGIAIGYEDLNDHNTLRNDPAIQTAVDKIMPLASPSTLCRVENNANRKLAFLARIFHDKRSDWPENFCYKYKKRSTQTWDLKHR